MPDLWLDVDTEIQECPVNMLPLTDDTDFKTRETAVAYNATGMDLVWNFITCAGSFTQTAVTPATGSPPTDYAWVHQGDGMYTIDIPASGGGTINNDTEGFGWFTGVATGVLPWRGPTIGFRAAGLNDKMVETAYSTTRGLAGTALPDAAAEASGGLYTRGTGAGQINQDSNGRIDTNVAAISADSTAADNCELMFDGTGYAGGTTKLKVDLETIKTQAVTCAGGVTIPAATLASTTNITAASGVTLTATTGLGNQTANITGNLSGSVGSVTGAVGSVTGNVGGNVTGSVGSVTGAVGSVTGNVGGNVTGSVGSVAANGIAATSIATGAITNAKFAAGAIDAAAIADGAIDAATFAADVDAEILSYLVNDATRIDASALNTLSSHDPGEAIMGATDLGTGSGFSAIPWNAAWDAEVQSECADALAAYGAATATNVSDAAANVSVDEIQASALADLFNTNSGTTYSSAVAGSPVKEIADNAGGSSLSESGIADAVWNELLSGHTTSGSAGEALAAAGTAGDPWTTALPGSYGAGTAGKIIGDNLNATVSSRATQTSVDTIDDFLDTEVAAILADTNELQTDLVNGGRLDLLIDAIKAKTDNLPASPAAVGSAMTLANGAITAAVIDTGAIDADSIAADAGTEIATAVWASGTRTLTALDEDSTTIDLDGAITAAVPTAATIADAVWDEARAGHVGAGSFGEGVASVQGNVTGSVGSVTGAVGSVTGAVGSVTGNVGGSVASVTAGVTLANGAHGGAAATMTLKQMAVTNSDAGGIAVDIQGTGSGNSHAIRLSSTNAKAIAAASTNSDAISIDAPAGNAITYDGAELTAAIKTTLEASAGLLDLLAKAIVYKKILTFTGANEGNLEMFNAGGTSLGTITDAYTEDATTKIQAKLVP